MSERTFRRWRDRYQSEWGNALLAEPGRIRSLCTLDWATVDS